MQKVYDKLYAQSKNGNNFYKLLEIIGSEQNIRLAYRNIKTNSGSKTAGTDGLTIDDIKILSDETVIEEINKRLNNYKPQSVRRVYIPKPGTDKKRPLGIPTIWDRLIQQCILQVLEPICEPKFHNHSYGFRPNRGAHHAVSRVVSMVNMYRHYYCVDVDIKGFFDNVDHGKLLKQIWTIGIRDKRLICIISKILKSEIEGEGIPTKGTPQGGLISPLLSLIVLNELDWWVSNQWETYRPHKVKNNGNSRSKSWYANARKYTNLKDGFIVRYADDFKIMCRTYDEAQRYYYATVDFLKKRLKLEVSEEKSKVVNMRKNSSKFLGFKIKVVPKGKTRYGYIAKSDMSNKAIQKAKGNLKRKITNIQRHTTKEAIQNYNLAILGIQNYYCIATNIYNNLTDVGYALLAPIKNRLRHSSKTIPFKETDYEFQSKIRGIQEDTKIVVIDKIPLLPITGIHHKSPMNFPQGITDYTINGREKIHKNAICITDIDLITIAKLRCKSESIEFNDNSISVLFAQQGKCYVLGFKINVASMNFLRIKPKCASGADRYDNIILIESTIKKAVLEENANLAEEIIKRFQLNGTQLRKFNQLRINNGRLPTTRK